MKKCHGGSRGRFKAKVDLARLQKMPRDFQKMPREVLAAVLKQKLIWPVFQLAAQTGQMGFGGGYKAILDKSMHDA